MCSVEDRRAHQAALRRYICSDAMRQHLFNVERGITESRFRDDFKNTINHRGGIIKLCSRGFGPVADNEAEVCCSVP